MKAYKFLILSCFCALLSLLCTETFAQHTRPVRSSKARTSKTVKKTPAKKSTKTTKGSTVSFKTTTPYSLPSQKHLKAKGTSSKGTIYLQPHSGGNSDTLSMPAPKDPDKPTEPKDTDDDQKDDD